MVVSTSLSPLVQPLLAELRVQLNTMFRQRAAAGASVDGAQWLRLVEKYIAPIVASVHSQAPDRSKETLVALYGIGLDLASLGHFAESGGSLQIIRLWQDVFPKIANAMSLSPRATIGSLSNAALQLSQTSESIASTWNEMLGKVGPRSRNAEDLLSLGKFLAWTSGLAPIRSEAIRLAASLPAELLREPLGIPEAATEDAVRRLIASLETNPWARIASDGTFGVHQVACCGDFRGLGGHFFSPPKSYVHDGSIHVTDGREHWRLFADRYGQTFQRVDRKSAALDTKTSNPHLESNGVLKWDADRIERIDLRGYSSQSFDGTTLAVTIPTSYHVFLFAKEER